LMPDFQGHFQIIFAFLKFFPATKQISKSLIQANPRI